MYIWSRDFSWQVNNYHLMICLESVKVRRVSLIEIHSSDSEEELSDESPQSPDRGPDQPPPDPPLEPPSPNSAEPYNI